MTGEWYSMGEDAREEEYMAWYDQQDGDRGVAHYDYTDAGALMFSYPKDDEFTRQLRELVPQGFMHWQRDPFCWVIDADYADDVLAMAYRYFDEVEGGIG